MVLEPATVAFAIEGPLTRADLPGLRRRVNTLLARTKPALAFCDVEGVAPNAVTVDALCRLQISAKRHGCEIRLRRASAELRDLVAFMGLSDVLPE